MRYIRPMQRVSASKKTKEWQKQNVDYWCSLSSEYFTKEWSRMKENYLLHNNVIDQERFAAICDPLGLDDRLEIEYVQPFNKLPNKINVLVGEELKRPLLYSVIQNNDEVTNEISRAKDKELKEHIGVLLKQEITKAQGGELNEEQQAQFEQIESKYKNFKTQKETLLQMLLKLFLQQSNFKFKKNDGMYHALIAGLEAVHIYMLRGELKIEVVNPLGLFYHKSPEVQFIQDGDASGYVREMTSAEVIDRWGEVLSDADLEKLIPYSGVGSRHDKMGSKSGKSIRHFEHSTNGSRTLYNSDPEFMGSYGQSSMNSDYLKVHTAYWRSFKKIGFLKQINEFGDEEVTFVDEKFKLPKYAEKIKYMTKFFEDKVKYDWDDYSLEWNWVPQIWEGTRIENDIYVNVRPLPWQKVNLGDPHYAPLPIFGAPYNTRNAPIVSLFDRGKYWQYLFFAIMHKWIKLIMQDKSVIHTLNQSMFDKEVPMEMALKYAMEIGVLPYNPQASFDALAGQHNTQKVIETFNLSNPNLERYTNILMYVENQIGEAMGVTKQREGQISQYSTASDTRQSIIQSSHITETEFKLHNEIWEQVARYVTKSLPYITEDKKIRAALNDAHSAILDLSLLNPFDEFDLRIEDSQQAYENLSIIKQNAQAIIQNDENALEYLVSILEADSLPEVKLSLEVIKGEIEQRVAAQREHESKLQQEQATASKEAQEDQQAHEIELEHIKGDYDIRAKEIDVFKFQETLDSNNNGIPDPLEIEKLRMAADDSKHKRKIDYKSVELKEKELKLKEKALNKKPTSK
tara:strand:+ start:8274 stop:10670 length:2397 start_codon:yes stop_codon:yes gene_type:complete